MSNRKLKQKQNREVLPEIPDRLYFTIGDVSRLCAVKTHILRYWEQEFPQLTPVKRGSNRRYYTRKDIHTVRRIKELVYHKGYTTEGARKYLVNPSPDDNNGMDSCARSFIISKLKDVSLLLDKC